MIGGNLRLFFVKLCLKVHIICSRENKPKLEFEPYKVEKKKILNLALSARMSVLCIR